MEKMPFFSVIIPTYNRADQLASCLEAIANQDFPHDRFEVILVDDGSDVSPEPVVASFKDRLSMTLIRCDNAGPAAARNRGAAAAKGEYLAFTDDDCLPSREWISRIASFLAEHPECAVGGQTVNALPGNLFSTASQILIDFVYSHYNSHKDRARFLATNNLVVPKGQFFAIQGFDPEMRTAEDRDICYRWQNQGYCMNFVPDAVIYHEHRLNFLSYWKQHLNYGRGAFCFRRKVARRLESNLTLESARYYFDMLRYPLSMNPNVKGLSLFVLLVISQTAGSIGFFSEWIKSSFKSVHRPNSTG